MSGKNKNLAIFIVLILFIVSLMPVTALREDFDVKSQNNILNVCACSYAKNVIEIKNKGDVTSVYEITKSNEAAQWAALTETEFTLKPWEEKQITQYVSAPCSADGKYPLNTQIRTIFETEKNIEQTVDVRTCNNIQVRAPSLTKTTCPCKPAQFTFTIYNSGAHFEKYSVSVTPTEHVSLSQKTLLIPAGEKMDVVVFITKPCDVTGDFDYTLKVEGHGSNLVGEVPFTHVVSQCYDYTLTGADSLIVCQDFENVVSMEIQNTADVANTFEMSALIDYDDEYSYGSVFALPKQTLPVDVVVDATGVEAGEHVLTVKAVSERGAIEQSKEILMNVAYCDENGNPVEYVEEEEETTIPWWLWLVLGILLLGLIGLGVIFALKKPTEGEERDTLSDESKKEKKGLGPGMWVLLILAILFVLGGIAALVYLLTGGIADLGFNETMNMTMNESLFVEDLELEEVPLEEEFINDTNATGMSAVLHSPLFYVLILLILTLMLLLPLLLGKKRLDEGDKEKKETKKEKKKEEPMIKHGKKKSLAWLWILLLALLLLGGIVGGVYLIAGAFGDENIMVVDEEGLTMDGDAIVVKPNEIVDIPVTIANAEPEDDYSLNLEVDLPWLSVDKNSIVVPAESEEVVVFTASPTNETEQGTYRLLFDIAVGEEKTVVDEMTVKVQEERSFLQKYLWWMLIPLIIILLLILLLVIAARRRRKKGDSEYITSPVRKKIKPEHTVPPKGYGKYKKEKKKGGWLKALLITLLIVLLLAAIAGGIYYFTKPADVVGVNETETDDNYTGFEDLDEDIVEGDAVDISTEEPLNESNVIQVGRKKTLIPINIQNTNENYTYIIQVNEDVEWINTSVDSIEVAPLGTETIFMTVEPMAGAEDGRYRIGVDILMEGEEYPMFSNNLYMDIDKYGWLGDLVSYLLYIILGIVIAFLVIFILTRKKTDKPKSKKAAKRETVKLKKAKKGKTNLQLK